jgi:hypothetical protein
LSVFQGRHGVLLSGAAFAALASSKAAAAAGIRRPRPAARGMAPGKRMLPLLNPSNSNNDHNNESSQDQEQEQKLYSVTSAAFNAACTDPFLLVQR